MKKTDSFLEDRIRGKAKKHNLPSKHTVFWEDRPKEIDAEITSGLGNPVLLSASDTENFIVVCTRGSLVVTGGKPNDIVFSNVEKVTDFPMAPGEEKSNLTRLMFKLNNGEEVTFYPEPYKAAFSVWNILITLKRMS